MKQMKDTTPIAWNAEMEYENKAMFAFDLRVETTAEGKEAECTIEPQSGDGDDETLFAYAKKDAEGLTILLTGESVIDLDDDEELELFEHYDSLKAAVRSDYFEVFRRLVWSVEN